MQTYSRHGITQQQASDFDVAAPKEAVAQATTPENRLPENQTPSGMAPGIVAPGIAASGVVDPEGFGQTDVAHFWKAARYGDMECLNARYRKHSYALHTHDTYAVGLITECAERFYYRGEQWVAGAGQLVVVEPGELHNGQPDEEIFSYRMYYPAPALLSGLLEELTEKPQSYLSFPSAVIDDPALAHRLLLLHRRLEGTGSRLEVDGEFLGAMGQLALRHGQRRSALKTLGRERQPIRRVRDYLDAHAHEELDLADLAKLAGFSRFHLLRAFRKEVGVTPQVYQMDRRVARAKTLLDQGLALSLVALDCGFFDQAHFSRTFKQRVGVPPGHYRRARRGAEAR